MTLESVGDKAYNAVEPLVNRAARHGVTPNQLTSLSLLTALATAVLLWRSTPITYIAAALLIALNGVLDILDGELARRIGEQTKQGDYLDHAFDRYNDTLIIVGLAAGIEAWITGFFALSGVLLTAYMGTQAQAVGVGRIYEGILGRADILFLAAGGSVLAAFELGISMIGPVEAVLILYSVAGHLTVLQRFWVTWRELT